MDRIGTDTQPDQGLDERFGDGVHDVRSATREPKCSRMKPGTSWRRQHIASVCRDNQGACPTESGGKPVRREVGREDNVWVKHADSRSKFRNPCEITRELQTSRRSTAEVINRNTGQRIAAERHDPDFMSPREKVSRIQRSPVEARVGDDCYSHRSAPGRELLRVRGERTGVLMAGRSAADVGSRSSLRVQCVPQIAA